MNIAALRVRITIQKNETMVDENANHTSAWTDYFTCWATAVASGKSAEETSEAGTTQEADRLDFTIRLSSETAAIDSRHYRVKLGDRIYNIVGVDDMGFRRTCRKLNTILVAR
ncbi:MAG: phage head closure protein [Kiritimatiellae bacterium]|nr:phage head closure protein [Kiritimatiellia bacterium]